MKRVVARTAVSMVIASLLTACGGGDEADALPQISLADSATVKEKKSVTISATASDDKSVSGYQWQQVSGPALTLAQTATSSVVVTAPAVDADSTAVLRLTVTDSGKQSAEKTINVNISNNKVPQLTLTNSTTPEKASGKLSVSATDSDGNITSYAWKQTEGPTVTLTGANTATPTFIAPAVTMPTKLSFSVKVADDDNDSAEASSNVTIEQKFISYTIAGNAPAAAFNNAEVVLTSGDKEFVAKASPQGAFSLIAQTDDDAPKLKFGQLKVKSASITGLEYYAFLRDIQADAVAANSADAISTTTTLSVNEASTALFALIKQANGGAVPADIDKYQLLEKALVADELMEAAAVAKIAALGVHKLPSGQTLLDVLTNNSAYSAYVTAIETAEPGALTKAIAAIIADPALTPPMSAAEIPAAYYEMHAAGGQFLARVGYIYHFSPDGTGLRSSGFEQKTDKITWRMLDGALELKFAPDNGAVYYVGTGHPSIQALGAETVKLLQDNNISQIAVRRGIAKVMLQRVIKGSQVDSFRVTTDNSTKVLPLTVAGRELDPPALIETQTGDSVMRNGDVVQPLKYAAADLNNSSLTIPHAYSLPNSEVLYREQLQADVLEFQADGTGKGKISQVTFQWQVSNDGKLTISFADGEKTELTKFDEGFGYHSAIARIFDQSGQMLANWGVWVVKHELDSLKGKNAVNTAGSYWQSMVNLWRKDCWQGNKLLLTCTSTPGFSAFFGWEINSWPLAAEHSRGPDGRTSRAVSWEYDFDWVVIKRNKCGDSDCSRRVWWVLKDETIDNIRRVWALESNGNRAGPDAQYDMSIPFRVTRFDQTPLDYPDSLTQQQSGVTRLLKEPNQFDAQSQQ